MSPTNSEYVLILRSIKPNEIIKNGKTIYCTNSNIFKKQLNINTRILKTRILTLVLKTNISKSKIAKIDPPIKNKPNSVILVNEKTVLGITYMLIFSKSKIVKRIENNIKKTNIKILFLATILDDLKTNKKLIPT